MFTEKFINSFTFYIRLTLFWFAEVLESIPAGTAVGGSWSSRRKPTQAYGEHADTTQKDPSWGLKWKSACCEAAAQTITSPCCSLVIFNNIYPCQLSVSFALVHAAKLVLCTRVIADSSAQKEHTHTAREVEGEMGKYIFRFQKKNKLLPQIDLLI